VLSDDQAIMVFLDLMTAGGQGEHTGERSSGARVVLPVTASARATELCRSRGVEVVPAVLSPSGLMEAAASGGVAFAADRRGGYIFPRFLPAFDAAAGLVELIALLGAFAESLTDVVARVPDMPIEHMVVPTPFEQKGLVMRVLMEQLVEEGAELELLDGIKVHHANGWSLVVPDPEEPVTHVWAEGSDRDASQALAGALGARVEATLAVG
jgi:mannose-1-phosphate guanylyltransferase/phosphomannomutase